MSFRGISADNDVRFTNAEKKLLQSIKFPLEFSQKVDMTKVNLQVLKPWVSEKVTAALDFEDEVVIELVYSMLEPRFPDPRKCQLSLTGFLHKATGPFMKELWNLLLSAQESTGGIPAKILEEKKQELQRRREEDSKIGASLQHIMDGQQAPRIKMEEAQQSFDDFEKPLRMRQGNDHSYQGGRLGRRQETDDFGRQRRMSASSANNGQRGAPLRSPNNEKWRERDHVHEERPLREQVPSQRQARYRSDNRTIKKEDDDFSETRRPRSPTRSLMRIKDEPEETTDLALDSRSTELVKSSRPRSRDRKRSRSRRRERSRSHERSSRRRSSRDRPRRPSSRERHGRRHHRSRKSSRDPPDGSRERRSSRSRRAHRSRSPSTHRQSRRSAHERRELSPDRERRKQRRSRSSSRSLSRERDQGRSSKQDGSTSRSTSSRREGTVDVQSSSTEKVKDLRAEERALREKLLRRNLLSQVGLSGKDTGNKKE